MPSSDASTSNSDTINPKINRSKSTTSIKTGDMVYKLKGIVIHSGDASAGHYYSFIRNHNDSNWTEYNDSIVRPWDHKSRLLRDCFGGPHASENLWSWQAKNDASVSAYILVYEKQVSLDCKGDEHMEYSQCINPVELYSAGLSGGVARQIREG